MEQMVKREDDYQSQSGKLIAEPMSEATKIEQTRVAAEVAMQAELAKRYPRVMTKVFQRIEETFALSPELVEQSKFSFKRGGQNVQGFTIQFARAIAECVGNITYSFKELSRNDDQSEMFVYAWDLETNTMQSRSFIVKHVRDLKNNVTTDLTTQRDIYENNANNAAKRVRECILGVLPAAARIKGQTIVESLKRERYPIDGMAKISKEMVEKFKKLGVSRQELIKERDNRPCEMWMRSDFSILNEHYEDIQNEVKTIYDIFDIKQQTEIISDKINGKIADQPFSGDERREPQIQAKLHNGPLNQTTTSGMTAVVELRSLNKTHPSAILKAMDADKAFKTKMGKALNNRNQTLASELLSVVKTHISADVLSVNVSQLKKAFEDPEYIDNFERMDKDGEFSRKDIKTIINNNDDVLAVKALDSIRIN